MTLVYCRVCGHQLSASAPTCVGCGQPQPAGASVAALPLPGDVATEASWMRRFDLIDKAGGPKLPKLWSLPAGEVWAIKANLWAFVFGVFYYAVKGMWKKGLSLLGLSTAILIGGAIILESMGVDPSFLLLVGPAIFMGQANVSYYNHAKLGQRRWW